MQWGGEVSIKQKLRTILLCLALGAGSMIGVPMSPDEIEELFQQMNQPKIEVVVVEARDDGD